MMGNLIFNKLRGERLEDINQGFEPAIFPSPESRSLTIRPLSPMPTTPAVVLSSV
jgi:hypothetical protein